ncbi:MULTISPECIES: DUF6074 family protein [Mesorhizobium]|uniref:Uncharacterized protein n=1 Tax=Mesorhizobium australicum (strain HAMBI 3006 / LMG 24608 / WSM2073) TaxID=754035 RepID=L0KMP3_MESAW|nr:MULTISPECIES: DUF6074 family protein [Mesorhizobium]AGB45269.1 hypothetical protein Mesau_02886 [Mesorhizobium australicum WSM2073]MBZ9683657.1 DUF6074 family protein [Mesorhizobium sp. CO1-1-2]MBZ9696537.1 DUF6074 family protein [Mesorhizobium sp. CO1-1-9]MBZ9725471.1 DUF6074 family protein [Mesorhizobium sp. CO1-1-11]MBZ9923594.1 DUF6074 family protein [Mesorhizobium sp. BR1-1-4]
MSVSAFPVSRELSSVKVVADAIARLPNDEAALLWDETAKHLLSVAIERGHDTDQARTEVVRFFDAVQRIACYEKPTTMKSFVSHTIGLYRCPGVPAFVCVREGTGCSYLSQDVYRASRYQPDFEVLPWESEYRAARNATILADGDTSGKCRTKP